MLLRFVLVTVLFIFLARAFWRVVDGIIQGLTGQPRQPHVAGSSRQPPAVPMARDPICGTFVVPERAVTMVDGRTRLFFCSEACRDAYRARTA